MEVIQSINHTHISTSIGSPERAVDLTRDLIWAEAGRQLVDFTKITVSAKIYSRDGGVDGSTIDIEPQRYPGLLTKGTTYFQIKWGTTFDPRKEKSLTNELVGKNGLKKSLLCLAKENGRYVLVWFGNTFVGQEKEQCLERLQDIFRTYDFPKMNVDVLDRESIAQICNLHPVILSRYFLPLNQFFLTIDSWKDRFWNEQVHQKIFDSILQNYQGTVFTIAASINLNPYQPVQLISRDDDQYLQHRILVYKILAEDGFNQRTICVDADKFGPPLSTTLETRNDLNQILVIDGCKKEHHKKLLDVLGQRHRSLNMIVLSTDGNVIMNSSFAKIGWHGSEHSTFLHEIEKHGENEKINTQSSLYIEPKIPQLEKIQLPNHIEVTYCHITEKYGHQILSNAKRILRYLALFSSIGSENNRTKELEFLARNAEFDKNHWLDFAEIIHILREFGLIQGEYYLKISNQIHRQFLIQEWWEIYGPSFDFNEFLTNTYVFSENLAARLIDSLSYITSTEKGKEITKVLLGEFGVFSSGKLFHNTFGTRLFSKLTDADPESALNCLMQTIGKWSDEDLQKYDYFRRNIVFSLEQISWWGDLFEGAAFLLLRLGESETEHNIANNASGIFTDLFSPGYGRVASTETPPLKRFPIIKKILETGSEKKISLALKACNSALESTHFTRFVAGEGPSYGREFRPWMPKTYGEIFDYYKAVWKLLEEQIGKLKGKLRNQAVDILTGRARGLSRIQNLRDMVITTLDNLARDPEVDKEKIVDCLATILKFETKNLSDEDIKKLQKIDEFIMGTDYHSKLKRFVGMRLHLEFDDSKDQKLIDLAKEGTSKSLLKNEIKWLVRIGAKKAYRFGYHIGKEDKGFSLLGTILEEQKKTTDSDRDLNFLAGYLSAVFEADPDKCDTVLNTLSKSKKTIQWVPALLYGSRINLRDKDMIRLIQLAEKKKIKLIEFNRLFLGGVTRALSEKTFLKMISLLKSNEESYFTLLELYNQYFVHRQESKKLPQNISFSILTSKFITKKSMQAGFDMDVYSYAQIAKKFVNQYPKDGLRLIQKYLDEGNSEDSFIAKFDSEFEEILTELTTKNPDQVWELIKKYLGPPIDIVAYRLRNWLRGSGFFERGNGAIVLFNHNTVFKWVDENPQERATLLAHVVPSTLEKDGLQICWTREVLVRYSSLIDVRRELIANFNTEGFSGSEVEHYEKKKTALAKIRKSETDSKVLQWIDEYEVSLNYDIERGKHSEEGFNP